MGKTAKKLPERKFEMLGKTFTFDCVERPDGRFMLVLRDHEGNHVDMQYFDVGSLRTALQLRPEKTAVTKWLAGHPEVRARQRVDLNHDRYAAGVQTELFQLAWTDQVDGLLEQVEKDFGFVAIGKFLGVELYPDMK